jgi:hypothetical protein
MENQIKFVRMQKSAYSGIYLIADYHDDGLYNLASFLSLEISNSPFFVDWLHGKYRQDSAYGNAYGLVEYDNRIFVCFEHDSAEEQFNTTFSATKYEMLDIINKWIAIFVSGAREIMITQEGDTINIEPVN